jgi:hypothetical protein
LRPGKGSILRCALPLVCVASSVACGPGSYEVAKVPNRCSLHFDGADDFADAGIVVRGSPLALAGSPFTLSAWFRQEPGGDPYQRILDKSDEALAHNGWALAVDPKERQVHFYSHNGKRGGDFITSRKAYHTDVWHQVVAVARRNRLEIWIDGRRDSDSSYESGAHALPADAATGLRIGNWNHAPGRAFKGWLDEIAVWRVDLSADAVGALYAAHARADLARDWGPYRYSHDLVAWWRMERDAGSLAELSDSSTTGIAMRLMPDPASGNAPIVDCSSVP